MIILLALGLSLQVLYDVHNLAITNLGSISAQSLAGAIATGTHGSGLDYGIIASTIVSLRLVVPGGEVCGKST